MIRRALAYDFSQSGRLLRNSWHPRQSRQPASRNAPLSANKSDTRNPATAKAPHPLPSSASFRARATHHLHTFNESITVFANSRWIRWLKHSFHAFLLLHLIVTYAYTIRPTNGPSMLPTLHVTGDWILISKLHRRGRDVEVGDVVSFWHPVRQGYTAVKRVVGMPGDFVVRDTPRNYPDEGHDEEGAEKKPTWMVQVPMGHCWVAGDNLDWSRDSRHFGALPLALIKGKVIARVWPEPMWFRNPLNDGPSLDDEP